MHLQDFSLKSTFASTDFILFKMTLYCLNSKIFLKLCAALVL